MAGNDGFTKLLMHCNGTDGSTSFPDASTSSHSLTAVAQAQVDTAQSKFGGASALFDGGGDVVQGTDSSDWDWGTSDMAIDFWVRFTATGGNQAFCGRPTSGTSYFYFAYEAFNNIRFRDYNAGNIIDLNFGDPSLTSGVWYHIAITRSGSNFRLFIDGTQFGSTLTSSASFLNRSDVFEVGGNSVISYYLNGHIDEFRLSVGDSRWTSNFTPPTSEYTEDIADLLELNATLETPTIKVDATVIPSELSLTGSIEAPSGVGNIVSTNPSELELDVTLETPNIIIDSTVTPPELTLSSNIEPPAITGIHGSKFASAMAFNNPIFFVSDTSPAKITQVDISTPSSPVYTTEVLVGANNAKSMSINTVTEEIFVACADGKIIRLDLNNLATQSIVDLSDVDDLETISTLSEMGLTSTGTENAVAEMYLLDDRSTFTMDSDFQLIAEKQVQLDSNFNLIQSFKMDSNFYLISENKFVMDSDFKLITADPVNVAPIVRDDFHVYINSVELQDTDVDLSSIVVQKSEDEKDQATFKLSRRHDDLNNTLTGVSSIITSQNDVEIKIQSKTIFTGKVGIINPVYNTTTDQVNITAYGSIPTGKYNKVALSLPGQNESLNLYHILLQNYQINNEYIDPQEANPRKYKGISVSLGEEVEQHVLRFTDFDSLGVDAEKIQDGTFIPKQNWTYFWSPTVRKVGNYNIQNENSTLTAEDDKDISSLDLPVFKFGNVIPFDNIATGDTTAIHFKFIGTSLSPVSNDLWELLNATRRRQKILPNTSVKIGTGGTITVADLDEIVDNGSAIFTELQSNGWINGSGVIQDVFKYTTEPSDLKLTSSSCESSGVYSLMESRFGYQVGEAPFKNVSTRSGKLITKYKWEDGGDGLYSVRDEAYDYTEYAKRVANLEYQKLSNINGQIQPDTSCNIELTIDALLYFNLGILTRINIDNTVQAGIYKNNNGFPVSVKGYTISSSTMKVALQADNVKSKTELEDIDGKYPCEDDQEYIDKEKRIFIAQKSDMKTRLAVDN